MDYIILYRLTCTNAWFWFLHWINHVLCYCKKHMNDTAFLGIIKKICNWPSQKVQTTSLVKQRLSNWCEFHTNAETEKVWFIYCLASTTINPATDIFGKPKCLEKVAQGIFLTKWVLWNFANFASWVTEKEYIN